MVTYTCSIDPTRHRTTLRPSAGSARLRRVPSSRQFRLAFTVCGA